MKLFGKSEAAAVFGASMLLVMGNESASAEQIDAANAELTTAGLKGAQLVPSSVLEELTEKAGRTDAAELAATEAAGSLATATAGNEKLTTDLAAANTELATLRKLPGASHTNPALGAGQSDVGDEATDENQKAIDEMPHNSALDNHPLFGKRIPV